MINYNKYFEKVRYKNYKIDDFYNLKVLETLDMFNKILSNNNLNYILTGSVCLSILSHKIIRTWGDIDVLVEQDVLLKIKSLFKEQKIEWELITSKLQLLGVLNLKTQVKVQFVNYAMCEKDYQEISIKDITLKLSYPDKTFMAKFLRLNYNKKDLEDFKFFREFIDIENKAELIKMLLDKKVSPEDI